MRIMKNTIIKNKITALFSDRPVKNFITVIINNKKKYLNQWL